MALREGKRTKKLSAPANEKELQAYYDACTVANIEPADTLRKLAKAVVDHVERHGEFTFPIRLAAPKSAKE